MCGISGIYHLNNKDSLDTGLLREMTRLIRHRGPDDEGYALIDPVSGAVSGFAGGESTPAVKERYPMLGAGMSAPLGMGFRRLSIIDLSISGHQPMSDPVSGICITFNGEIYNAPELREELISAGYGFFSTSDTEVIIKAYHLWGQDCVRRFAGMWAFALWDPRQQTLFLSRDRYGIKPLYYADWNGVLYWGSELKQFMPAPIPKDLNIAMIWRSMKINSLLVYDEETFRREIKTLKPAHNLTVKAGKLDLQAYYSLDTEQFGKSKLSFEEAVENYRSLFLDSLRLHLRSDVEIGASLSGGMDSSAIVCSAAKFTGKGMQTFSSYYNADPAMDERKWIKLIVEQTGSLAHYISPSGTDAEAWLETVTYYNDVPTRAGYTSQWAVNKLAHETGIKVMLSGQGSDELLAGYKHAAYRFYADMVRSFDLRGLSRELPNYLKGTRSAEALARIAKIGLSTVLPESALYRLEFDHYRFEPFNKGFTHKAGDQAAEPILDKIRDIPGTRLANFLYNMLNTTSIQTLLHLEDRMSGANSVESRVPFLDHRLVDLSLSLPSEYKIKAPLQKYIHRLAMKDIVPEQIYNRADKGIFSSPFYNVWMSGTMKPYIEGILASTAFRQRGIWDLPMINLQWQRYLKGDKRPAEMLFHVIALEAWFRIYNDQPFIGR